MHCGNHSHRHIVVGPTYKPNNDDLPYSTHLNALAGAEHHDVFTLLSRSGPDTPHKGQQERQPQGPTGSNDPTQHAKGRTGDCPGPVNKQQPDGMSHRGVVFGFGLLPRRPKLQLLLLSVGLAAGVAGIHKMPFHPEHVGHPSCSTLKLGCPATTGDHYPGKTLSR